MQLSAELPCVTGGQQGSLLQLVLLFVKICPASLSLQSFIFFFFLWCWFPVLWSTLFFCNSGSGCWYSRYFFSSNFKPASRHLTSCVAYSDPWIHLQWVPNNPPCCILNSCRSLVLAQSLLCLGQALFLVCLLFTLKCLINTLLKKVAINPLKPLETCQCVRYWRSD